MRRRHQRAWLVLDSDAAKSECQVLDINSDGARLLVASDLSLPERFSVTLVPNSPPRPCEQIWRRGGLTGVRFTG